MCYDLKQPFFQLNTSHNYCKKTTEDTCEVLGTPDPAEVLKDPAEVLKDPAEVLKDPAKTTYTHNSRSDLRRQVLG